MNGLILATLPCILYTLQESTALNFYRRRIPGENVLKKVLNSIGGCTTCVPEALATWYRKLLQRVQLKQYNYMYKVAFGKLNLSNLILKVLA